MTGRYHRTIVIDQRSRSISWDGCVNVRDLGGIRTADGAETQPGRVIRADNVGVLTPEGWQSVADHGVVRIVDLRFPEEIADDPPRDLEIDVVNFRAEAGLDEARIQQLHAKLR